MILVDFDRTVFDSDGFYEAVRHLLPEPVSRQAWRQAYERYQKNHRHMHVFDLMRQECNIAPDELSFIKKAAYDMAPTFVYDDARQFLKQLSASKREYTFFTFGNHDFQNFKIDASGLGDHPRIVTSEPKGGHVILAKASMVIDDNPHELSSITQPGVTLIRIARPGLKYSGLKPELVFDELVTDLLNIQSLATSEQEAA